MEKTWKPGDTVRYYGTEHVREIEAGLFWYSGLGSGTLYRPDGTVAWCNTTEASELCANDGVKFLWVDSFDYFSPIYLGD